MDPDPEIFTRILQHCEMTFSHTFYISGNIDPMFMKISAEDRTGFGRDPSGGGGLRCPNALVCC